jgi:hypothetical protein
LANLILILVGAIFPILWGIVHIIKTKAVVKDFGDISQDNKYIITMEWIVEGMTLIFIGSLVLLITLLGGPSNIVTVYVNIIGSVMLFALALLSLFTGFKVNFIAYKLCLPIFTVSGLLILLGTFL